MGRLILSLTVLAALVCSLTLAQSSVPKYTVYKIASPPVIDGRKDNVWDFVPRIDKFFAIKGAKNQSGVIYEKDPDNYLDASPSFRVLYDDKYLYFYAETYDDTLNIDKVGWEMPGSRAYNEDCFEIFLDGDYTRGTKYDGKTEGEIWFLPEEKNILFNTDYQRGFEIKNILWDQHIWKNAEGRKIGWNIEVAIPLADIYLNPAKNKLFGMDLKYSDDDGNQLNTATTAPGNDREHNLRWSLDKDAHNPANFYTVSLSTQFVTDKIEINNVPVPPMIDGDVDSMWNGVKEYSLNRYSHAASLKNYADANVTFKIVNTPASIHFLIVVEDDIVGTSNTNENENDGLALFFDGDNTCTNTYDTNTTGFYLSFNAHGTLNAPRAVDPRSTGNLTAIRYAAKKIGNRWNVELEIPKKDLSISGDTFGFELYYYDDDDGGDKKDCTITFRDSTFGAVLNPSQLSRAILTNQTVSVKKNEEMPTGFNLFQNYPNPFNPETSITYTVPNDGHVALNIFDVLGRKISSIVDEYQTAGRYRVTLDMQKNAHASGIYFSRLEYNGRRITRKMEYIQ